MNLDNLKSIVVLIGLIALIGAAAGIALDDFSSEVTQNGTAYNITMSGLDGIQNTTSYLDTIGTIAGVAVLIGIVIVAFTFARR